MDEIRDSKPEVPQEEISSEEKDKLRREEFEKKLAAEKVEREKSKGGNKIYRYGAMALGILIVAGAIYYALPIFMTPATPSNTNSGGATGGYLVAAGKPIGEIYCYQMEGQAMHIHSELQVYADGEQTSVPANIGVTSTCMYWLHTHTPDGLIHIESPVVRTFTLGQFLDVWGKQLFEDGAVVKALVDKQDGNGFQEFSGNYRDIILTSHEVIAIGTGEFTPKPFTFGYGL